MKTALIIFLLIPVFCKSQTTPLPDSLYDIHWLRDTSESEPLLLDTIAVSMMVSNDFSQPNVSTDSTLVVDTIITKRYRFNDDAIHVISGYVVRTTMYSRTYRSVGTDIPEYENAYIDVFYLDENKQPLSNNIIVWKTKEKTFSWKPENSYLWDKKK